MSLSSAEIVPGSIAYFTMDVLNNHKDIVTPEYVDSKPCNRPFVCIDANDVKSSWTELTTVGVTKSGYMRVDLTGQVENGFGKFLKGTYLNDGRTIYSGSNAAFVEASQEAETFSGSRPSLTSVGLVAVRQEISKLADKQ